MHRPLAWVIYVYAGLTAAQWGHATRRLHDRPEVLRCGNAVSDPFALIVSVVAPAAVVCAALIARRCFIERRMPNSAITSLLAFAVTSAWLVHQARILGDYGLDVGRVWWLPWL